MQYFWKKPVEHHMCLNVVYFTRVWEKLPKSLGIWILQALKVLCGFFKYFDSVKVTAETSFLKDAAIYNSGNHITVMFTGRITATQQY